MNPHEMHGGETASRWITRFAHLIPAGGRVLDLASGHGRHARWLAARGFDVLAVDRDEAALATLADTPGVTTRVLDLEAGAWPLAGERFAGIVVANYLHRPHLAALVGTLAGDGALLYETFAQGNEAYGRPANPAFLLAPGELVELARDKLTVVAFEQGLDAMAERNAVVQRLAAVGSARAWPPALRARDPASARLQRMR
jgi:SAM-dependent methyltransferase